MASNAAPTDAVAPVMAATAPVDQPLRAPSHLDDADESEWEYEYSNTETEVGIPPSRDEQTKTAGC